MLPSETQFHEKINTNLKIQENGSKEKNLTIRKEKNDNETGLYLS